MPDLLDFKLTRLSAVSVTVPRWQVEGRIVDSATQQDTLADFTGANAVVFPTVLGQLTQAKRDEWVQKVVTDLIYERFGIGG